MPMPKEQDAMDLRKLLFLHAFPGLDPVLTVCDDFVYLHVR